MADRRRLPRSLAYLFAGTVVSRLGTFVIPYLTLYLSQDRGFSFAATGRIVAAGSLGLLGGNVAGGWLADRWSRKGTLLAALAINVLGLAGLAGASLQGWTYAACLFVALLGAGMYTPAANAVIADVTDEATRPYAYTVNYVCINVGMGLGPLLGGLLAAVAYRWLFVGDIATTLACFALIAAGLKLPRSPARARRTRGSPIAVWRAHPVVFSFCAIGFFVIAPLMGLEYAVPILVGVEFHAPAHYVGLVYTVNALCILTLSFPIERLIAGRSESLMMVIAASLWTVGLAILALGFSVGALLVCTLVWTLGEIIASIVVPTYVSRRVPEHSKGRMLAATDAMRSLAGITMPLALGLLWDASGATAVLFALLALPLIGVGAYAHRFRRAQTRRASTAVRP